jgi:magnesium-transporting ATPase (P-type)
MDMPPRKVGKRLIGRFLFLRIMLGTMILIMVVIGSTFWAKDNGYDLEHQRSVAFNVLDFGAISICLSARFSYNSSIHPRLFRGNAFCWWSVLIVVVLQIAITYIPGLNSVIFNMAPMDGTLWFVTFLGMLITFLVMEAEKALRRYLKDHGSDTDDRVTSPIFDQKVVSDGHVNLPDGASRLGLEELKS